MCPCKINPRMIASATMPPPMKPIFLFSYIIYKSKLTFLLQIMLCLF
uniref:Uncharacterized protein n=1 Tax=uncultured gamma proteobacterium EB080_L93H08 TaxID=710973 RepID=E0Y2U4_9GAMM|nr:hypothetical protein [uncultured gamma proteobacterium EB080_L93H08]